MKTYLPLLFCTLPLLASSQGGSITNNRYNTSLIGNAGPTSESFSASYGQLYVSSSQPLIFEVENEWVIIPFDTFGPSSNVTGSVLSPATLTINEAGVYQVNLTVYLSSEDSEEGPFTQTTYTVGTSLNGNTTIPHATVYAGEAGYFSLSFNFLGEFSANDSIRFYINSSNLGGGPGGINDNVVTLIQGNANLVQIAQ